MFKPYKDGFSSFPKAGDLGIGEKLPAGIGMKRYSKVISLPECPFIIGHYCTFVGKIWDRLFVCFFLDPVFNSNNNRKLKREIEVLGFFCMIKKQPAVADVRQPGMIKINSPIPAALPAWYS